MLVAQAASRDRGGRAGADLQGLRLRRQGGPRDDGPAARGGRHLRRPARRGVLDAVVDSPFTRYPAYRCSLDEIVGILHVRDLFKALYEEGIENVSIEELLPARLRRAGDEGPRRAARRVPADEPAHGDRRRRVRRDAGHRHAGKPARGDRRRDRGRVRPAGRGLRAGGRPPHPHRRHVPDRRLQRAVPAGAAAGGLPHGRRLRLRRAGPGPGAGRRGRLERPAVQRRRDRGGADRAAGGGVHARARRGGAGRAGARLRVSILGRPCPARSVPFAGAAASPTGRTPRAAAAGGARPAVERSPASGLRSRRGWPASACARSATWSSTGRAGTRRRRRSGGSPTSSARTRS